jgi:hypothetical protein
MPNLRDVPGSDCFAVQSRLPVSFAVTFATPQ